MNEVKDMYHSLIDIDLLEKGLHEKDFLANMLFVCYNEVAATSNLRKGGAYMILVSSFFVSVLAGVVTHYICKWLDRYFDSRQ